MAQAADVLTPPPAASGRLGLFARFMGFLRLPQGDVFAVAGVAHDVPALSPDCLDSPSMMTRHRRRRQSAGPSPSYR